MRRGRAGAAARAGRDLRARLEAQRRRPVLVRACGALFREAGPLGPAARRRALRLALRSAPALVAAGFSALLALGVFADLALGWPQAGAVGLLLATLAAVSLRRARASAAGRPATAREQLELGSLYIVAAHAVAQTAAGGGLEGPLYPVVYLVMAFLVSFLPRGVGLALVAFAVGLEAVLWRGRGGIREEIPAAAAHAGFIVLFAVLYHAVLWAQLAASRGAERAAVQRRLREIDERAREYRLLAPAAGDGRGPGGAGPAPRRGGRGRGRGRGARHAGGGRGRAAEPHLRRLPAHARRRPARRCASAGRGAIGWRRGSRRGEGALGSVVARAVPLRLQGEVRTATYYEDGTRPRALLAVPLLDRRGGHVRGVLLADRLQGEPFGDDDEALLQKLAVELLRAVAAERLMGDLQRSRDEKERFYSAIELLNRTTKPREVFDATLRVAAGIAPIDFGAVTLVEPGEGKGLHRVARVLLGSPDEKRAAGLDGLSFPDNAGLVASAVQLGATLPGRDLDISHAVVFDEATRLRGLASLRVIPLKTADGVLGTLVVGARREGAFGREAVRQLEVIAMQAADAVLRARLFEQTERLATTDGLTGLANHRTFQARLDEHLLAAARYGKRLSLILCDIDHFKTVNDTYGHPAGDVVLKGVARALQREARATDLVARYGGEEFAIVMPETDAPGALVIAERIREKVRALAFQTELGRLQVTLSLGVATCPDDGARKAQLVEAADACLYHAKRHGRNRTVSAANLRAGRRAAAGGSA